MFSVRYPRPQVSLGCGTPASPLGPVRRRCCGFLEVRTVQRDTGTGRLAVLASSRWPMLISAGVHLSLLSPLSLARAHSAGPASSSLFTVAVPNKLCRCVCSFCSILCQDEKNLNSDSRGEVSNSELDDIELASLF